MDRASASYVVGSCLELGQGWCIQLLNIWCNVIPLAKGSTLKTLNNNIIKQCILLKKGWRLEITYVAKGKLIQNLYYPRDDILLKRRVLNAVECNLALYRGPPVLNYITKLPLLPIHLIIQEWNSAFFAAAWRQLRYKFTAVTVSLARNAPAAIFLLTLEALNAALCAGASLRGRPLSLRTNMGQQ